MKQSQQWSILFGLFLLLYPTGLLFAKGKTGSLLWKISGKELKSPSYLFGTYHLSPYTFLKGVNGFDKAFDSVQQLICEIDTIDSTVRADFAEKMRMPSDTAYADLLTPREIALLDSVLWKYMMIRSEQLTVQPHLVITLLMVAKAEEISETSSDLIKNTDDYIRHAAQAVKYPIVALETAEEQLEMLYDHPPLKEQARQLIQTFEHSDRYWKLIQEMNEAYIQQDLYAIETIFQKTQQLSDSFDNPGPSPESNELLKKRNEKWMQRIPGLIRERPSLIAVGALHLPSEYGLIALLRKAGYTVEPI